MGSPVTGGRGMDQGGDLHTRIGSLVLFQVKTDIIANGLRQTGGSDADGRRLVLARQVVQGDPQVVGAAEDGRRFAEIRGGNIYGLLEMADHVAAYISRTAL